MIRRPPRSTPFPTRRSSDLIGAAGIPVNPGDLLMIYNANNSNGVLQTVTSVSGQTLNFKVWPETLVDRKSTRLNSSHTVISYAVFCLKKKNRRRHRPPDSRL